MKIQHIYFLGLLISATVLYLFSAPTKAVPKIPIKVIDAPSGLDCEVIENKIKVTQPQHQLKSYVFSYIIRPNSKRWRKLQDGTFQLSKYDRGNYNSKNQLVGTNRSIAAKTYEQYTGKTATIPRMKAISCNLAKNIYRDMFWKDIMKGHKMKVHNPILLDMIFNAICSSNGTSHFKTVLNTMTGYSDKEWKITEEEIEYFNRLCENPLREAEFYKRYWNIRNEYYALKSKKKGHRGLNRWIKDYDVNAYDFLSKTNNN
jgi:hypothetical protein